MEQFENSDLEFKEVYVSDIKKEVIAFANTDGGTLYVGVRKDGSIIGVDNPDEVMLQIAGSLKDSIRPDIMSFVKIHSVQRNEKYIIEVNVEVGSARPYYLHEKGLKPAGVYVRRGSSSQPLSDEGIREMILQTSGKAYEKCRSMNQELTFSALQHEMQIRGLSIGTPQMHTLQLIDENGLYTNLALLLSDQCEHTTKVAIFQGSDKAIFRDRKEFDGSLLHQLNETYQLINLFNKTKATFSGLQRIDQRDYPEDAVREALLNSIVHRDYSFSGSTLINLYDDRIEFVSLGGLVPGLSMEAIFMGVSQSRNPLLAAVFYRMKLIESYGTGIGKIQRLYSGEFVLPQFDTAKGVFRVILPNRNEQSVPLQTPSVYPGLVCEPHTAYHNSQKEQLYQFARNNGQIRRKDAEELLGFKTTKTFQLLKELCDEGKLCAIGKGRSSYYKPLP